MCVVIMIVCLSQLSGGKYPCPPDYCASYMYTCMQLAANFILGLRPSNSVSLLSQIPEFLISTCAQHISLTSNGIQENSVACNHHCVAHYIPY